MREILLDNWLWRFSFCFYLFIDINNYPLPSRPIWPEDDKEMKANCQRSLTLLLYYIFKKIFQICHGHVYQNNSPVTFDHPTFLRTLYIVWKFLVTIFEGIDMILFYVLTSCHYKMALVSTKHTHPPKMCQNNNLCLWK